jgi:RNA polymerase sigma factor (TIGR02999 family)
MSDSPPQTPLSPEGVTQLLVAASNGDKAASSQVFPLVYAQLRALAQQYMLGERPDHTLQATGLVHEAYMRLMQHRALDGKGRGYFYVAAADAMRRVLIDHARQHATLKRGRDRASVPLSLAELSAGRGWSDLLAVDEAIEQLAAADPAAANVVRLRFFAGLSVDETAQALGVSARTVDREWQYAAAWLRKHLAS